MPKRKTSVDVDVRVNKTADKSPFSRMIKTQDKGFGKLKQPILTSNKGEKSSIDKETINTTEDSASLVPTLPNLPKYMGKFDTKMEDHSPLIKPS